jgi:hypothetical protein
MRRATITRRLSAISRRMQKLREELAVLDEELLVVASDADDARIRALVSETPLAERQAAEASRHLTAIESRRTEIVGELHDLELMQDDLLDRLRASESL